jgi:hypothetical protein
MSEPHKIVDGPAGLPTPENDPVGRFRQVSAHTPGPWGLTRMNGEPAVGADTEDGGLVAVTVEGSDSAREANARLIAAAPDLLAALQTIRNAAAMGIDGRGDWHRTILLEADTALAKARGE